MNMMKNTLPDSFGRLAAYLLVVSCFVKGQVEVKNIQGDTLVSEGENKSFNCEINNFQSNYVISWSKDGRRITRQGTVIDDDLEKRQESGDFILLLSTDRDFTNSATSVINFPSIKRDDSGVYACEVYSVDQLLLTSKSIEIYVMYSPSTEYPKCQPEEEIFARLGQSLIISCLSEEGSPLVRLSWKRDFGNWKFTEVEGIFSRGNGFINSEIVIPQVTLNERDSVFVCTLQREESDIPRRCSVRIQVVLPEPLISISPKVGLAVIGQSIEFNCFSYLEMSGLFWSSEPDGIQTDSRVTISPNRQILTLSNITARDNGTVIFCSFQFKDSWIQTDAVLNVVDILTEQAQNTGSSGSSAVGSALGWMIAFILVCLIVIASLLAFLFRRRLNSNRSKDKHANSVYQQGNEVPPYVINRIGSGETTTEGTNGAGNNEYTEGHDYSTMEVGEYAAYHGTRNPPGSEESVQQENRHRPLQRVNAEIPAATQNVPQENSGYEVPDGSARRAELENPEYMTHGNYMGARMPNRPIQVRNLSHVSEATTVEPDYMPVVL